MEPKFSFKSKVWLWSASKAAWHFLTVPSETSSQIKGFGIPRKGFGSIPVIVKVGNTEWRTSIFPEKKGTFLLPLKAGVRKKENILIGDELKVSITLQIDF